MGRRDEDEEEEEENTMEVKLRKISKILEILLEG